MAGCILTVLRCTMGAHWPAGAFHILFLVKYIKYYANSDDMATLSLCMITKNEEEWLERCIGSCRDFVDEIIVADTGSTDRTKEIAKKYGCNIFDVGWHDDFSAARNQSIKHATKDWIIYLDADETISSKDWKKLKELLKSKNSDAYLLYQRNYTFDKNLFGWQPNDEYPECKGSGFFISPITRVFRNDKNYSFTHKVHETIDKSILDKKDVIKNSKIPIHHYGYLKDHMFITEKRDKYLKLGLSQIKATPSSPRSHYEVAMIYKNTKRYNKAEEYLKKTAEFDPNYKLVFTSLGDVYIKQGKIKEAVEAYKESIKRKNDEHAYINLGMLAYNLGNINESIKILSKSLEINPRNATAYNNLGLILVKAKKYRPALSILEKGFEKTKLPEFKKAIDALKKRFTEALKIETLRKEQKYDELENHLNERIKKNPNDLTAYTHLGNIYIKANKKKKAIRTLITAVKYNKRKEPLCINLYVNLANLLVEAGKFEKAEEIIKLALEIAPKDEFLKKKLRFVQKSL